jgi:mono/diheme cytochrome c family protein
MRSTIVTVGLACVLGLAARAGAAETVVAGSDVYRSYCAVCHGTSARGDGSLAGSLRTRPADLTRLAQRNGGTFPRDEVVRTVDGRRPVKGHGGGDMPVWGDAFRQSSDGGDEAAVAARISAVVEHLDLLQER